LKTRKTTAKSLHSITSKDGTRIAYEKHGNGPALVLVPGALCDRNCASMPRLVALLAKSFAVYQFDRRGKGDSGDTQPYSVDREIEDIDAFIDKAGGKSYLYGHSSGGALALEAAARLGDKVKRLALYEVPYNDDPTAQNAWKDYIHQLTELLAAGRNGDAVALFMRYTGVPAGQIEGIRHAPFWPGMEAMAQTLAYDHTTILGETAAIPVKTAARIAVPTLVMSGAFSYPFMHQTARTLSRTIPHARLMMLEGQTHDVTPEALAPVLAEFFL
jgi:pimeloyl-ACP methyl ester carboxylesterase